MDHLSYYGLQSEPFSIVPLVDFYYHNDQHDQAFMRLKRSVDGMRGLAVLVGDVGTGKTLLARRLLESLPDEEYEASMIVVLHSDVTGQWLVRRIAEQLGVADAGGDKVELLGKLYGRLNEIAESGKRAAILIDEAHMLRSRDALEELRGMLNLELANAKLLSIVMFGMPELDDCLSSEPALRQRMAVRTSLRNFTRDVLVDYVRFRVFHAGATQQVFSPEAFDEIFALSKGNPRLVNVICDNAIFEGYVRRAELPLSREVVESVGLDLGLPPKEPADEPAERR
jgi:general secretion pathway protein A